jgi:hypothetical protein
MDDDNDAKTDVSMPEGLDAKGQAAYQAIMKVLSASGATRTGGCKAFYSPEEWAAKGERYGLKSKLVVVYDGGDHRPYFTLDSEQYDLVEKMQEALKEHGMFFEEAMTWYGAVYLA